MPAREAAVPSALSSNDAALSELESRIEALIRRLAPVSRVVDEKSPSPLPDASKSNTPMVELLENQRRRIDRVIQILSQATDLLEV
jgi:hypothetical protein